MRGHKREEATARENQVAGLPGKGRVCRHEEREKNREQIKDVKKSKKIAWI